MRSLILALVITAGACAAPITIVTQDFTADHLQFVGETTLVDPTMLPAPLNLWGISTLDQALSQYEQSAILSLTVDGTPITIPITIHYFHGIAFAEVYASGSTTVSPSSNPTMVLSIASADTFIMGDPPYYESVRVTPTPEPSTWITGLGAIALIGPQLRGHRRHAAKS